MTLLSGVLGLWNYHLAPISVQICNKDNTSALCVYWRTTHEVNDPIFGTTLLHIFESLEHTGDGHCSAFTM